MVMGGQGKNGVRISEPRAVQQVLDVFFSYGHKELDTARVYAEGTTEPVSQPFSLFGIILNQYVRRHLLSST
jgi:aflatoxin B1 aldehyde reductase